MKLYYIYHVEGVKIGCSVNPKKRVKDQGYGAFQVLEVHEDIEVASKREIELQLEYGYKKDNLQYIQTINNPTYEGRSKAGKIAGKKAVESGHWASLKTPNHQSKAGKIGGKIGGKKAVESGQISNLGKIFGKINGSMNGKKSSAIERTCSYCSKTIKGNSYFSYHGPRCKLVPVTT